MQALRPGLSCQQAVRLVAAAFRQADTDCAQDDDARILVLAATGLSRVALIAEPETALSPAAATRLVAMVRRRLAHEPVTRILGRREFWGLEFVVTSAVLDPRADSETVVGAALRAMAARRGERLRILDLGTGSGALLCALLTEFPRAIGLGIDLAPDAAAVAAQNVQRLGLAARGAISVGAWAASAAACFDLVVSNPPYITSADIPRLDPEVRLYDPLLALDGGDSGFDAYATLARQIPQVLAPASAVCIEAGAGQAARISQIFAACGLATAAVDTDLGGHAHCVTLRRA